MTVEQLEKGRQLYYKIEGLKSELDRLEPTEQVRFYTSRNTDKVLVFPTNSKAEGQMDEEIALVCELKRTMREFLTRRLAQLEDQFKLM